MRVNSLVYCIPEILLRAALACTNSACPSQTKVEDLDLLAPGTMMLKKNGSSRRDTIEDANGARPIAYDELPQYVGYQVRRAQARIFAEFEAALEGSDFTPGTFGVLTLIRANPGITQVALAAAFGVDKSTMSPVIFRLEKRGFIRRAVLPSDRRCHALHFEPANEEAYLRARERIRAFENGVAARLTDQEQKELARLLLKLQAEQQ